MTLKPVLPVRGYFKMGLLESNSHCIVFQDFHQFMPHLLSNIFGFDQTSGWGLRYLTTSHPEFELVYTFLSPGGDIFNILMKLDDKEFSYEFPLPVGICAVTKLLA